MYFFLGYWSGHPQINSLDSFEMIEHGIISRVKWCNVNVSQICENISQLIEPIFLDQAPSVDYRRSTQVIKREFFHVAELSAKLLNGCCIDSRRPKSKTSNLKQRSKIMVIQTANLSIGQVEVCDLLILDKFWKRHIVEPLTSVEINVFELWKPSNLSLCRAIVHELTGSEHKSLQRRGLP